MDQRVLIYCQQVHGFCPELTISAKKETKEVRRKLH